MKTNSDDIGFLRGGGEMGELVRNFDWSKTELGTPSRWPLSLQTTVGIILHSAFPMFLFWGKNLLCFYNDAYRPSLGKDGKHPLVGKGGKEAWPDIWDFIGPLIQKVMTTGEAVWFEDQFLPIYRNGKMEDVYWTFSYSPAYGDDGEVAGVFVTCTETTDKVKAMAVVNDTARQLEFAIDAADLGTWELNPVTNKFKGNARLKKWFGLNPDEEIELSLATNVIAVKDRQKVNDAISEALRYGSGGHYDIEYTIQNPITSQEIIVKAKGKAHFNEKNEPYTFSGTLQDVTEEVELRKHLLLLQDAVPAMIFYMDNDQRYRSYNGVFMEWFNVNASEALGKTTREFIGDAAYKKAAPHLDKAYAGERVQYEMHAPQRIDGEKWLSIVYTPHKNSEGKVVGVIVHATDVTKSKLIERSLRSSELFSREIFYNSPVAKIVFTGNDMIIERVNENMLAMLGRDESIVGKPFSEVMPELLETPLMDRMREVLATGKTYMQPEAKMTLLKSGKPYTGYYKYIYKPLISATGDIYGIICTSTELTEQVIARMRIEAKEKELRDLITASPIGICVLSGDPVWVEEVNDRFLLIAGKTREEFENAPYWVVMKEIASMFESILADVFKTGVKYTSEEHEMVLIRGGVPEKIFATFEYIPVTDENNVVIKVILITVEVTHQVETRRKIEEAVIERTTELRESNLRLKRSNEELEQFAYIASHDLQEPIRKISTFTQMLELSLGDTSEKSKDYLSKIYSSTDRMGKLVRDVLAYSRIRDESQEYEVVDLNTILETVVVDFELTITETQATVEIESLPSIKAISGQMLQLFGNLMSNSLKYRKPGVEPLIKISSSIATKEKVAKRMALDPNREYHHIEFRDNGIGFNKDYVDKIFRIFQRLHGKTEYEGTGIGLAICLKIVHNHQGHISAAVGENGGAVFNILLPAI